MKEISFGIAQDLTRGVCGSQLGDHYMGDCRFKTVGQVHWHEHLACLFHTQILALTSMFFQYLQAHVCLKIFAQFSPYEAILP